MSKKLLFVAGGILFYFLFIRGKATSEPGPYKFEPTKTRKKFIEENGQRDISAAPRIVVPSVKTAKVAGGSSGFAGAIDV